MADLREHGSDVRTGRGEGWGTLVDHPQRSQLPAATVAAISAWLDAGRVHAAAPPPLPEVRQGLELELDGSRVRETAMTIEHADGRVFGILSKPADEPPDDRLTVLLLNPGALRRSGPNRLWTKVARRWAARGIAVLRLDVRGIGDADGEDGRLVDDAGLYEPAMVAQVRAAMDAAAARGLPDRFLLAGLCSGAAWSFEAAVADERVHTAAMINPRVFVFERWVGASRDWRRAVGALRPSRWRELVEAERPVARAVALLPYVARAPQRAVARRCAGRGPHEDGAADPVEQGLATLAARGQHLALRFSGREPLHEEIVADGVLDRLLGRPGTSFSQLPGDSHTLKPLHAQEAAKRELDAILDAALTR